MIKVFSQSAPVRKSRAYLQQIPRVLRSFNVNHDMYLDTPPVVSNSFPKSGTHLLNQITEALPSTRDYGTFWAVMPSVTFRERSPETMVRAINRLIPGELVSAHLHFDSRYSQDLAQKNAVHYFIYRDLRDIVISEAHYLTKMNRWHRLHPYFKNLPSDEARISFSIKGNIDPSFPYDYPNIAERFKRFEGWLTMGDVLAVKFEDLVSEKRDNKVGQIVSYYCAKSTHQNDVADLTQRALHNIDPLRSHTFRKGKSGGWRDIFTETHKRQFKEVAGDLLTKLGYEQDFNW